MEIKTLGLAIDPTRMVEGANRAKTALKDVGQTAGAELGKVDAAAEKTGQRVVRMGKETKVGFGEMARGVSDFLDAIGVLDGPMGNLLRRAVAMGTTVNNLRGLWAGLQAAQTAAGGAMAASAAGAATATAALASTSAALVTTTAASATAAGGVAAANATIAGTTRTAAAAWSVAVGTATSLRAAASATTPALIGMSGAMTLAATSSTAMTRSMMSQAEMLRVIDAVAKMASRSLGAMNVPLLADPRVIDIDAEVIDSVENLSDGLITLADAAAGVPPPLEQVPPLLDDLGAGAGGAGTRIRGLAAAMPYLIAGLVALVAIIGAVVIALVALKQTFDLVRKAMDLAGPIQQSELSFKTMIGTMKEAKEVMDQLRATSKATGADLGGSSSTVKRFLALGFTPEDALKLNTSILDVAGSIGMTAEEAKLLGAALAQVQAKGVVSMEELRQQIAEKGVPVFDELQRKVGKFGNEFFKAVESGQVPAKDLIDIFLNLEGSFAKFAGGAVGMTQTLPGAIARLKANWEDLLIAMGMPINDAITPLINLLSDTMGGLTGYATAFGTAIGNSIKTIHMAFADGTIGELFQLALMAAIETAMQYMTVAWAATVALISTLFIRAWTGAIVAIIKGFTTLFVAAIQIVVGLFTGNMNVGITKTAQTMSSGFATVMTYIGATMYNELGQAGEDVANAFAQAMFAVINAVSAAFTDIMKKASGIPGLGKMIGPVGAPAKIDATFDLFTPRAVPDLGDLAKGAEDLFGNKFSDQLESVMGDKVAEWEKQFGKTDKPVEKMPPNPAGLPPGGAEGAGGTGGAEDIPKGVLVDEPFADLMREWKDLEKAIVEGSVTVAKSLADNLTGAITSWVEGTKSAKEAFGDMANAIISDILRIVVQMYVQLAVQAAITALGGGVAHTGGVAGSPNLTSTGAAVPKYHKGGMNSAEQMIKVERGETVITKRRADELEAALNRKSAATQPAQSGGGTTIVNVMDRREILDVVAANPDVLINTLSRRQDQLRRLATSKERK